MTVLPIIVAPDPILKTRSEKVEKITPEILQLMNDMLDTMYAARGVGLSAVQVGVLKRVITIDIEQDERGKAGKPIKMINPEIISSSAEINIYNEGCLSFPGQYADVERPAAVTIRYLDEQGKTQTIHADELMATCVQHEIDHMDGIVFVDHISRIKRDMILRRLKKANK